MSMTCCGAVPVAAGLIKSMPSSLLVTMRALALLALAACALASAAASTDTSGPIQLDLVDLTAYDPEAKCNDGSHAGLYWRPATSSAGSSDFLLYLQGGDWCWDEASCHERWLKAPQLMSSKGWSATYSDDGIFSADSPLSGANLAFLAYCTSDGHMGDRAASSDSFGWHFRGRRAVRAAVLAMTHLGGLGRVNSGANNHTRSNWPWRFRSHPQRLFFGGASAGARGAMVALDFIAGYLPAAASDEAAAPVAVFGVLDSPLWLDIPPMPHSAFPGFAAVTAAVYHLANATAHITADCAAVFASEPWKCLFAQYRMPFLAQPYLLYASMFDSFQLGTNIGHPAPYTSPAEAVYVASFAAAVRETVASLPPKDSPIAPGSGVFSSACNNHAKSLSRVFVTETVDGLSMADALAAVVKGGAGPARTVEVCSTINCGAGCPA